jgi:chromosome segregation ATPase
MSSFDPKSTDAVLSALITRLDEQDRRAAELRETVLREFREVRGRLDQIAEQTTKTNGRVTRHDDALEDVAQRLCPTPGRCGELAESIDELKAVRNQAKGAGWLVGILWTVFGGVVTAMAITLLTRS